MRSISQLSKASFIAYSLRFLFLRGLAEDESDEESELEVSEEDEKESSESSLSVPVVLEVSLVLESSSFSEEELSEVLESSLEPELLLSPSVELLFSSSLPLDPVIRSDLVCVFLSLFITVVLDGR